MCSLARNGQNIAAVEQLDDGSVLTAAIPSDARTFGGELRIEIHAVGETTRIDAAARIPGQLYDWGKSKKTLATLIANIPAHRPSAVYQVSKEVVGAVAQVQKTAHKTLRLVIGELHRLSRTMTPQPASRFPPSGPDR